MPIPFACSCGYRLDAPEESVGRPVRCPFCGTETVVPGPAVVSRKAIAALVLGLLSLPLLFVGVLVGFAAIVLANRSVKEIDRSLGRVRGKRLADAGLVLGVLGMVVSG